LLLEQGAVLLQTEGVLLLEVFESRQDFAVLREQAPLRVVFLPAMAVCDQREAIESQSIDRESYGWRQPVQPGVGKQEGVDAKRLMSGIPQRGISRPGRPVIHLVKFAAPTTK
jgi:hypothetical protein